MTGALPRRSESDNVVTGMVAETASSNMNNLELDNSSLSIPAAIVLGCFFFCICVLICLAPRDNLIIVSDLFKECLSFFKSIFIEGVFEIVVLKGLGGAFYELKVSIDLAICKIYADFSLDKLVTFVTISVVIQHIPWIVDKVVKLFT